MSKEDGGTTSKTRSSAVEWGGRGYTLKRNQDNKSHFATVVDWMRVLSRGVKKEDQDQSKCPSTESDGQLSKLGKDS